MHYKKAPYYTETIELIRDIFDNDEHNVSNFIQNQLKVICEYLDIKTKFIESSFWQIGLDNSLNVEDRAVKKLKKLKSLGVDHFINPIGGKELYSKEFFNKNSFELSFLESKADSYVQFSNDFHENLSVLDVLMFNSRDAIKNMLNQYILS